MTMSSQLQTIFLAFFVVFLANIETTTNASRCEKITIPFCKNLGYNHTIFPNNLDHETQEEARGDASEFTSLVDSQCSRDIVYFLCSLYAPVCTMMKAALPPCRSLCKSARYGCEDLMNNFGFRWPEKFSCDRFPRAGQSLCVGRNASSSSESTSKKTFKRSGKKTASQKLRQQKPCSSASGHGKLCCRLGRRAAKKGFYCNLKRKENTETRKSIKFRKTVIRKCSKYSSCFHSCCEARRQRHS